MVIFLLVLPVVISMAALSLECTVVLHSDIERGAGKTQNEQGDEWSYVGFRQERKNKI